MLQALGEKGLKVLNNEKPFSAVTDWIERLCGDRYDEDDIVDMPELVDVINIQSTGPAEASRAIRKKLKYGSTHRQIRALVILKACVENCGVKFQSEFANGPLVERIKILAADPSTDPKVKKRLMWVLGSWHAQFKDDPSMRIVAGLYAACGGGRAEADRRAYLKEQARLETERQIRSDRRCAEILQREEEAKKLQQDQDYAKKKAAYLKNKREEAARAESEARQKEMREAAEKERLRKEAKKNKNKKPEKKVPFNFEAEKPKILLAVAEAAQGANSLVNALQHVNRERESVDQNSKVQDALTKLKTTRRQIIRYIQLCERDPTGEFIGTLLSANDQIVAGLQLYDRMVAQPADDDTDDEAEALATRAKAGVEPQTPSSPNTEAVREGQEAGNLSAKMGKMRVTGELDKLQGRQKAEIARSIRSFRMDSYSGRDSPSSTQGVHEDLKGLNFDPFSPTSRQSFDSGLAPPITPGIADENYGSSSFSNTGNLSDFSDYDSSDEEYHHSHASSSNRRSGEYNDRKAYMQFLDDEERPHAVDAKGLLSAADDPFADPVEDDGGITPGLDPSKRMAFKEV